MEVVVSSREKDAFAPVQVGGEVAVALSNHVRDEVGVGRGHEDVDVVRYPHVAARVVVRTHPHAPHSSWKGVPPSNRVHSPLQLPRGVPSRDANASCTDPPYRGEDLPQHPSLLQLAPERPPRKPSLQASEKGTVHRFPKCDRVAPQLPTRRRKSRRRVHTVRIVVQERQTQDLRPETV